MRMSVTHVLPFTSCEFSEFGIKQGRTLLRLLFAGNKCIFDMYRVYLYLFYLLHNICHIYCVYLLMYIYIYIDTNM